MIAVELRGGNKPSLNEVLGWIGSRVDDIYGANVGRLEDVWIDPGSGAPRWLLVKEGRFGGRTTLIPFEDATAGAGHVWVPYEREIVRGAPEIEPGAPLTHQVEASLRSHYAASAPSAVAGGRGDQAPPPAYSRDTAAGLGTATVGLHGAAEGEAPATFGFGEGSPAPQGARPPDPAPRQPPPQPRRHVLREQPSPPAERGGLPPYQLPARPAPPIAAPHQPPRQPNQPPPAYSQPAPPPPPAYAPPPEAYSPPPQAYSPPELRYAPPVQAPPQQWASPAYSSQPPAPPDPVESLRSLAASPEVHYVEIELAGELSIRGELRSVRVVPRR